MFTFLFLLKVGLVCSQNLWYDESRKPIPTFTNKGIAPNTMVNIYKSGLVIDNIFNTGTDEEELYASIRFDDRSRPVEIKESTPRKNFPFYKTTFEYESDKTFSATLFEGENHRIHKWFLKDSTLVEECTFYAGRVNMTWKYRIDSVGTSYDEKYNHLGKLVRVAILKKDSVDTDSRYCVWKKNKLMQMSLYQFNEEGNPKRVELLSTDDLNKAAKKLGIPRSDLSEFDAERIRMALIGLTYYWNFEYDKNRELTKQILYDEFSQEVGMVQYFRDESGNLESVIADADIANQIPWYEFYEDLSGLAKSKAVYYYQGLELLNVTNHTLYDFEGRPVESTFEYVGHNVGGHREKYRYVYILE